MASSPGKLDVVVLTVPESTAGTIFGMYDLFCSAGRDWQLVTTERVVRRARERGLVSRAADLLVLTVEGRRKAELAVLHPDRV